MTTNKILEDIITILSSLEKLAKAADELGLEIFSQKLWVINWNLMVQFTKLKQENEKINEINKKLEYELAVIQNQIFCS